MLSRHLIAKARNHVCVHSQRVEVRVLDRHRLASINDAVYINSIVYGVNKDGIVFYALVRHIGIDYSIPNGTPAARKQTNAGEIAA